MNEELEELRDTIAFRKEWENIVSLLMKENSLDALCEEILERSVNLTESSFGILLFTDEDVSGLVKVKFSDRNNLLPEKDSLVTEIESHLNFLLKWFENNKKPINVKSGDEKNIAYPILSLLQAEDVVIVPSFLNGKILSLFILGEPNTFYSKVDIRNMEQFASALAFSVDNLLTRKLKDDLESKLLQSQKLETIGKLASGMAHDFNNLLSSIFGSLNLLKRKLSDREDIQYLLENIENCSGRAADLTKGLLSYGKPTAKRKTLVKPGSLMKELILVISQTFPDSIQIEENIEEGLHDFLGNATEIYQVILNLCVNAKEAIHGEGKVSVATKNVTIGENGNAESPFLKSGEYICFSVKDTGEGISEENLHRIFDPYFSTKQKETGGGLGLYVTYGIVKAHNGYIDVKSKPGKGTEFLVYVPAYIQSTEAKTEKTEQMILLADDEIMLRDILEELLESYGYHVIAVPNGAEALRVLTEEFQVDLLIIDYKMPEMDGITCIKKLKELNIKVPTILSTGSASSKEEENFGSLKIDSILSKPYEFERMLEEVKKLI